MAEETKAAPAKPPAKPAAKTEIKTMKIHPLANLLPRMSKKEYADTTADVKEFGIREPLTVTKDKSTIIDGRHRWYIAHDLGLKMSEIPLEVFKGKEADIPGFIISKNLMRRNIEDADQRVAIALQIRGETLEKEAKARQAAKGSFNGQPASKGSVAEKLASEAKVSQHKAEQAIKAKRAGLLGKVARGHMKLRDAAKKAPPSKRQMSQPKRKQPTFEDKVWARWQSWIKKWKPSEVRQVKELVKGWLQGKAAPKAA